MSRAKRIILRGLWVVLAMVGIAISSVMAFMYLAPQIGSPPEGDHLDRISKSSNYQNGTFVNLVETKMDYGLSNTWGMMTDAMSAKNTSPSQPIATLFEQRPDLDVSDSSLVVTWYGHSAVLLETGGQRIFLDPMLGPAASPLPIFGTRFENVPLFEVNDVPTIDAVIFSHDHYDHLDYPSVMKLKDRVGHFFVPFGLGSHLKRWGVPEEKITELDWWGSVNFGTFEFIATPARHFSGRGFGDGNKTLWASWVIRSPYYSIYFSGDSGYGPHFKEIGEKYGPFDLTMMECGQYNKRWHPIHMMPDETVRAHLDLRGNFLIPIHWGAFSLAPHSWTDPAEQVSGFAKQENVQLITPQVGQRFALEIELPKKSWWITED